MNLIVTGGAGFIGSHFIRTVIDRPEVARVVNLDCLTYAGSPENLGEVNSHPKYRHELCDLRDSDALRNVFESGSADCVVHFAAETHVDRSISGPAAFLQTNVTGTFNLLEACRFAWKAGEAGPRTRFLHVSTDEVYGSAEGDVRFSEVSSLNPNSPYAASKASADLVVRAYQQTYRLPAMITRCSNNFGPCQFPEKLIPVVIQAILEGRPIPVYGDGRQVRDWIFVRDHVEALWQVLVSGKTGEVYNIGADNEWINLDLIRLLCDLVDEARDAAVGKSRKLIASVSDRPGHDRRYALDSAKIGRALEWRPSADFHAALRETVRWYLDHQNWVKSALERGKKGR